MLDPRDASAADTRDALVKARTLIDQGGYHQAEVICRKVLETNPGLPDAIYLMGILATRSHFYDDGEALFRQAIASRGHPIFYRDLSRCLVAAGREEDALVALGEGLERVPNNVDLLAFRGQLLSIFGRKDEAIASMNRVLELAPKKAPHFSIARLTKYDSADHPHLKLMEELLLRPDIDVDQRAQLRFGAAHAYDQLGDYEKGFALLAAGNRHKHETVVPSRAFRDHGHGRDPGRDAGADRGHAAFGDDAGRTDPVLTSLGEGCR
jgi:tetratricopeptide (TPR) repeat protein